MQVFVNVNVSRARARMRVQEILKNAWYNGGRRAAVEASPHGRSVHRGWHRPKMKQMRLSWYQNIPTLQPCMK